MVARVAGIPSYKAAALSAKPNARADKRRNDRLWQLYQLAFQRLMDRHICLPPHLYDEAGDREWESAQAAMTLAICAAAKWEAYEAAHPTPRKNPEEDDL